MNVYGQQWIVSGWWQTASLLGEMGARLVVAFVYCPTECNADTAGNDRFWREFQVADEGPKGCSRVAHSRVVSWLRS